MSTFLEPVYLNESMMLNCAAYLFEGVTAEIEKAEERSSGKKGGLALGGKFLKELLGLSGSFDADIRSVSHQKLAKKYTTGALHMTVVDELRKTDGLNTINNIYEFKNDKSYIGIETILKPVDFYSIIETLKISTPLILKVLHDFGEKINPKIFNNKTRTEIVKYDELIRTILENFEKDYLKSSLLEMIMLDPKNETQIGVVDIDVNEKDPAEIKAKLTDGKFYLIGKITKNIERGESIELLKRSFLSTIMGIISNLLAINQEDGTLNKFQLGVAVAKPHIERICQLSIPGPAVRVMAMSVCI